jgi:hypothetical protein
LLTLYTSMHDYIKYSATNLSCTAFYRYLADKFQQTTAEPLPVNHNKWTHFTKATSQNDKGKNIAPASQLELYSLQQGNYWSEMPQQERIIGSLRIRVTYHIQTEKLTYWVSVASAVIWCDRCIRLKMRSDTWTSPIDYKLTSQHGSHYLSFLPRNTLNGIQK